MLDKVRRSTPVRAIVSFLLTAVLVGSLAGCGNRGSTSPGLGEFRSPSTAGQISEVSPPDVIQQLRPALEEYQPQVSILSPQADEVLQDTTLSVQFQVQDLPIFKNPNLGLGPHLHVILDNQPYEAVYNLNEPLVFKDLAPGTHTLRAFASRPWHESFKNEGAYAQTTFHIFTKTADNNPDPGKPLLTYSRPKGTYGAEPILLDFYLTNAPLHLVAQEKPNDEISDWRIRVTINGESFVLDKWQPIYLKGFKPGKNWVQLEFLNEQGNLIDNVFNSTVRLITYEPKGKDTLSKMVRGELKPADVQGIVDPNYAGKPPALAPTPSVEEPLTPPLEAVPPQPEVEPIPSAEPAPSALQQPEQPKGGFFNRFRRPDIPPSPISPLPEGTETPLPETAAPETIPLPGELSEPEPSVTPTPELTPEKPAEPVPAPKQLEQPKGGFFNRFRRPDVSPSPLPTPPVVIEEPSAELEVTPQPDASLEPEVAPADPIPNLFVKPEPPKRGGFFNRPRRPEAEVVPPSPSVTPTLPEVLETPAPEPAPKAEEKPPGKLSPIAPSKPEKPKFEPPSVLESPAAPSESPTLPEIINTPKAEPKPTVQEEATEFGESSAGSAESKSKVDLKQLLIPQPTPSPALKIIQVPADNDIPSSFLKKSAPTPPAESEASETTVPPTSESPSAEETE